MSPGGSAYRAEPQESLGGAPLPLTAVVVDPRGGGLYFIPGGRRTQSGLYRVTYIGKESTQPSGLCLSERPAPPFLSPLGKSVAVRGEPGPGPLHAVRHRLEAFHGKAECAAVGTAWPYLSHEDRYIRFAARVAI